MQKWEYMVQTIRESYIDEFLEKRGNEAWELVSAIKTIDSDADDLETAFILFMKRPKD